ncbi:MAG: hypothetical protein Q9223_007238 [Gallowayella weberi]
MHLALSTSYLLPAIFLNPVLFLHGLNTILSRIIPPILDQGPIQPPPYSTFGPSAKYPHLDVHASDNLCWSYTVVMICAQLMAFGRVQRLRAEGKEARRIKRERAEAGQPLPLANGVVVSNGHATMPSKDNTSPNYKVNGTFPRRRPKDLESPNGQLDGPRQFSRDDSEDSEVIL